MKPWLALVGVTKQTAKGAAAGTATFGFGLMSGAVHKLEVTQDEQKITLTRRVAGDVNRTAAIPGITFTSRVHAKPLPLFLYGALGSIATVGASNPYTHTVQPGTDLPYLHLFGRQDTEYVNVRDCHVASLTIRWQGAEPPELSADLLGLLPTYEAAAWTITNDESLSAFMPTAGGTFQAQGSGTAVASARIKSGEITIENGISPTMLSASILPDDVPSGPLSIRASITIVPTTDLSDWQKIVTNTGTGTAVQSTPVYGALDVLFTLDSNTSLQIQLTRLAFTADWPDADPSSTDEIELVLEGVAVQNAANDGIKFIVRNAIASY